MKTKILQFGEGNFLRCFIDWMVQKMNDSAGFDGAVQIIQPIGDELSAPSKILNERGGRYHTCLRGVAGGKTVEEIEDPDFNAFVRKVVFEEIYPTVDLPDEEKTEYAESVLERFANPFAHHQLKSIALNTVAKWKTRCLPVVCDYAAKFGRLPENMMQGYEAMARHYDNQSA